MKTVIAPGIVMLDVSDQLPQHRTKRYRNRDVSKIIRQYHHHSGALGKSGIDGVLASVRYVVRKRKFPGAPYHLWIPWRPVRRDGALCFFRLQPDILRTWHTGGQANTHGVSVAWQGNSTQTRQSPSQIEIAEALIPWWMEQHPAMAADPEPLSWHSDSKRFGGSGKKACPGAGVQAWLEAYRGSM